MSLDLTNLHESPTLRVSGAITPPCLSEKRKSTGTDSANKDPPLHLPRPISTTSHDSGSYLSTTSNDSGNYTGRGISPLELGVLEPRPDTLETKPLFLEPRPDTLETKPLIEPRPDTLETKPLFSEGFRGVPYSTVYLQPNVGTRRRPPRLRRACSRCRQRNVIVRT